MFKIGLENCDFCKSLHFYIVDAGKKTKKQKTKNKKQKTKNKKQKTKNKKQKTKNKKQKTKNELHLLACSAALGPSGRGHRPKGDAFTIFLSCAAGRLPAP